MPGDFLRRTPQLTMEQFHAFRDERPKEEKWELIDGVPIEMDRPTLLHQRIASNLQRVLNARLELVRPEWQADRSVHVWLKGDEKSNPEPDVTVIDTAFALGQIYVERFYFVVEILSDSDKAVLEAKLAYYKQHEHNRCVLFVRQDQVGADQHDRRNGGKWRRRRLVDPAESLAFPDIGTIGRLGDLYKYTPLDPFAAH
jgi:Uma2 family endonuclease